MAELVEPPLQIGEHRDWSQGNSRDREAPEHRCSGDSRHSRTSAGTAKGNTAVSSAGA